MPFFLDKLLLKYILYYRSSFDNFFQKGGISKMELKELRNICRVLIFVPLVFAIYFFASTYTIGGYGNQALRSPTAKDVMIALNLAVYQFLVLGQAFFAFLLISEYDRLDSEHGCFIFVIRFLIMSFGAILALGVFLGIGIYYYEPELSFTEKFFLITEQAVLIIITLLGTVIMVKDSLESIKWFI